MKSAKKTIETLLAKTPIKINGKNSFDLQIHIPSFYDLIRKDGSLGFGEVTWKDGGIVRTLMTSFI